LHVHGDGEEREARAPQEVGLQLVELVVGAVLLLVVPVDEMGVMGVLGVSCVYVFVYVLMLDASTHIKHTHTQTESHHAPAKGEEDADHVRGAAGPGAGEALLAVVVALHAVPRDGGPVVLLLLFFVLG
jgi:hypothetical protein